VFAELLEPLALPALGPSSANILKLHIGVERGTHQRHSGCPGTLSLYGPMLQHPGHRVLRCRLLKLLELVNTARLDNRRVTIPAVVDSGGVSGGVSGGG
jgi:hypothetical protein